MTSLELLIATRNGDWPTTHRLMASGRPRVLEEGLVRACESGHLEIVQGLVEAGVDVTAGGALGLQEALIAGHEPVVEYLLTHSPDLLDRAWTGACARPWDGPVPGLLLTLLQYGVDGELVAAERRRQPHLRAFIGDYQSRVEGRRQLVKGAHTTVTH